MTNQKINIVWFKRDLRFTDHEPLFEAQKTGLPILLLYCFETSMMAHPDADVRHWRFVNESLLEMNGRLKALDAQLFIFHDEVLTVLLEISKNYSIQNIFSHQEVGNRLSFDRDIAVAEFCKKENITWREYQLNGVIRKLKSRKTWEPRWEKYMAEYPKLVPEENWNILKLDEKLYIKLKGNPLDSEITTRNKNFQEG
ncbi:MAG: deoxyribodipyrimidine photo-lyase, partial [Bacteroidota bacterium]